MHGSLSNLSVAESDVFRHIGQASRPLRAVEIAQELDLDLRAVLSATAELTRREFVERTTRGRGVRLTDYGRLQLPRLDP